jgi:hypothetical protein
MASAAIVASYRSSASSLFSRVRVPPEIRYAET